MEPTMISTLCKENEELRKKVLELENKLETKNKINSDLFNDSITEYGKLYKEYIENLPLKNEEYQRYGRQILVPEVGISGQVAIKNAKVLVVGAGGLGSPVIEYLGAAGVGTIGIVDDDKVEMSNLHRQVIHNENTIGEYKAISAAKFVNDINPHVKVIPYLSRFTAECAFSIMENLDEPENLSKSKLDNNQDQLINLALKSKSNYDLVIDCTDNPATRYLISDVCVVLNVPLVSASALKTEGQLSIFNFRNGPCYRCYFPTPPPASNVQSCGEGGIIGPVVGIMGVLQAIEAIKIILALDVKKSQKINNDSNTIDNENNDEFQPMMILFTPFHAPFTSSSWRSIKMRNRKNTCIACGDSEHRKITKKSIISGGTKEYISFCGPPEGYPFLKPGEEQITIESFYNIYIKNNLSDSILLDVRDSNQFLICHLPQSVSFPLSSLTSTIKSNLESTSDKNNIVENIFAKCDLPKISKLSKNSKVYIICRLGNDSRTATKLLRKELGMTNVYDIQGGLLAWNKKIDNSFPIY